MLDRGSPNRGSRSAYLFEFPQGAYRLRAGLVGEETRPQCPADFADIDVAKRVDGHAVRAEKLCRPQPGVWIADPRQELALVIDDADPRPEIGFAVYRRARTEFADIADRVLGVRHVEPARSVQVVPLGLIFAVAVEHLHSMVLAIGDINPAVGIGADIVRDVELTRLGAGLTQDNRSLPSGEYLWTRALP